MKYNTFITHMLNATIKDDKNLLRFPTFIITLNIVITGLNH